MEVSWDAPLGAIVGKASKNGKALVKATQFETVGDLLQHFPRAYVPKGRLSEIEEMEEGAMLSLVGEVVGLTPHTYQDKRTRRTAYRLEVKIRTENQRFDLTYFDRHQNTAEWRRRELAVGRVGMFSGRTKKWRETWQLINPDSRMFDDEAGETAAAMPDLIPIYPEVGAISTWALEETIALALELVSDIPDLLPASVREERELITGPLAYRWVHRPDDHRQLAAARKRLKFDEALLTQTVLARRRLAKEGEVATVRDGGGSLLSQFDQRLPFELTEGQREVGEEIFADLARPHPMHRLLQGEVGSGKTLVALRAMLRVVDSGGQAALLAPTEVLAQQHARSIGAMLGDLGEGGHLGAADGATRVALLTGSMGTAARRQAMLDIASGEAGIVIGTHAILEDKLRFFDLGLVVVDEQHRFGVEQRAALSAKAATPPHVLVMTATPIPRTVAMTVFGDLETSTLHQVPAGRGDVRTTVIATQAHPTWLAAAWERVAEAVGSGRQAYVVCPRIGDEPPPEEGPVLQAVLEVAERLATGPLRSLRVEALHGRMSPDDKERVMRAFASGEIDVLVSTTVIEVGVDVPNASVMIILDADRFGVSQLHQLRGRIGRGGHDGLCLLVTDADPESASLERLAAVASTRDGFELSRIDLIQRREGNLLGVQQSGARRVLRLLSVLDDEEVILAARDVATGLVSIDPALASAQDLDRAARALESTEQATYMEMG
ncbi:MAG: ATP-dependent DNA helicase RecG [Marmoricola sp.]